MNIGIIGTGNIASYLLEQVNANHMANGKVTAVFGRNREVGMRLSEQFDADFYMDLQEFLKTPLDIVVEAATMEAAALYLYEVVAHKKDLVVSSIGVFKDVASWMKSENWRRLQGRRFTCHPVQSEDWTYCNRLKRLAA